MRLLQDLKYIGTDNKLKCYGSAPWHCTSFVSEYSTGEMKYCVQQPYYHEGVLMGYMNLNIYLLNEDELVENFKIIKEDGTLEDIKHSKDNKELQQTIKEIDDYFKNISDEELEKLLTKN